MVGRPRRAAIGKASGGFRMIQGRLFNHLDTVAARYRQLRLSQSLAIIWLVAAVVAVGIWIWIARSGSPAGMPATVLLLATAAFAAITAWFISTSTHSYGWIA